MSDAYDYSLHYRNFHDGSKQELEERASHYSRLLDEEIKKYPKKSFVLDYGCGDGGLTYFLSKCFDNVLGVDASKEQIESAHQHGINAEHLLLSNFDAWVEGKIDTYDLIFLFDVLEHIPVSEQIGFMRSLCKTLKPGGEIFIKVPNANAMLASRWRYIDWTHHCSFTEHSLNFVCLNSGLARPEYLTDDSSMIPKYWWIPRYSMLRFYLKMIFRGWWWIYVRSELGPQARGIKLGVNLLARARRSI